MTEVITFFPKGWGFSRIKSHLHIRRLLPQNVAKTFECPGATGDLWGSPGNGPERSFLYVIQLPPLL